MSLERILTGDGSHSLYSSKFDEPYHSRHGAIQESKHVFIKMGLEASPKKNDPLRIFEMGFGTGLNALLTGNYAQKENVKIEYQSIEAFPLTLKQVKELNYESHIKESATGMLQKLHNCEWGSWAAINEHFRLLKIEDVLETAKLPPEHFDLVYFDAFAPSSQPNLWSIEIFRKLYGIMAHGSMLCTYCAKGQVRRNMIAASFEVEKLPGPPGKREMLRAKK